MPLTFDIPYFSSASGNARVFTNPVKTDQSEGVPGCLSGLVCSETFFRFLSARRPSPLFFCSPFITLPAPQLTECLEEANTKSEADLKIRVRLIIVIRPRRVQFREQLGE